MISSHYVAKSPKGDFLDLTIEIGLPEPDPEPGGDFRCKVTIKAFKIETFSFGVDQLQAHSLSIKLLNMLLIEKQTQGWLFYFPDDLDHAMDFENGFF